MDYLEARGLLRPGSRRNVLSTRLVIVAARHRSSRVRPAEHGADASRDSLRATLEVRLGERGRLAVGDPSHVPAGRYARAALSWLGAWTRLQPRLAPAENVRSALAFVARGEAPLGIVYETDALAEPRVEIVGRFPAAAHPPITYPFALTRMARDGADQLLAYLAGAAAAPIWRALGFRVLPGD
jgi:molybdate transport system substrate-binding protein